MANAGKGADRWLTVLLILILVGSLLLLVQGAVLAVRQHDFTVLGLGLLAVLMTLGVWLVAGREGGGATDSELLQQQVRLLQLISERMLISDQAKRISYRQKDRDALRHAIIEDLRKEDYDAAMALVNDMADVYGYREEAEQFRQQILDAQAKQRRAMIGDAVNQIDAILARHDWILAEHEIDRLTRMYPDHLEVRQLPQRLREAREKYKLDLIREFKEAFDREDNDRATELLTEMDRYLTPDEARPYMDLAREVLARKRENLGVQFKMAVQDRDWIRALAVGEQIIREFPNSGFAGEVREMLDTLRERAAQQRTAVAGG